MKFLIVERSPFSIFILLGPKYSPQDSAIRDDVSLFYSATANIIVSHILTLKKLKRQKCLN